MCGIAGLLDISRNEDNERIVRTMTDTMIHRGPDDSGIRVCGPAVLGHRRLSIIDVEASRQPLSNEDETVWTTFNGEIYNYKELRDVLRQKGHVFRTKGDTEVLVHLYEEFGENMLDKLQGMFAFAIWDVVEQKLILARDRMGIKPLYYIEYDKRFIFASEPKAICQYPGYLARPNVVGIWHYMTYRSVPAPYTLYEGMRKIKPGHYLRVEKSSCHEYQYWDIPPDRTEGKKVTNIKVIADRVEELLRRSVRRRMLSDVPIGACLSGGVDSSLIVAIMSGLTNAPVKTYTVGFENYVDSEVPFASKVAKLYGTQHNELFLKEEDFLKKLRELTWIRDGPLSEPADVPINLLSEMASREVKVLLSGEGSDELFAGYPKYAFDSLAPWIAAFPEAIINAVIQSMPAEFRRVETALRSLREKSAPDRWAQWFSPFITTEKRLLLPLENEPRNPSAQYYNNTWARRSLSSMLYSDCKIWLPDNLLERGDRMTMGASVENRVPFLDHELVEFAFTLPDNLKIRSYERKWLIKQIALRYLPKEIVFRKKIGFSVPLKRWFRGKMRSFCYDTVLSDDFLEKSMFSRPNLETILDDHCRGRKDNAIKIWTLLGLSLWFSVCCKKYKNASALETRMVYK